MRKEILLSMSTEELDRYASVIGVNTSDMPETAEKVSAIMSKRERTHEVMLLGAVFSIPARNIRDKRFSDALSEGFTDASMEAAARIALGDAQWKKLIERATDDDGVIDVDAVGMAVVQILTDPELKNY